MRRFFKTRLVPGLLLAGVVLGFGSGFHHLAHHRHAHVDRLTEVCVDAALGRDPGVVGRHDRWDRWDHWDRWVAERCAAHARDATAP
ncbi:MAG: hypothetical protein KDK70_29580 [Myxococcales bacterium]|nr:hypothetical protein [Myxococcales bacterium]